MSNSRCPKNEAEKEFFEKAVSEGWEPSKRGWPDFICYRDGEVIFVEVKRRGRRGLKEQQFRVMRILATAGLKCYLWDSGRGFQRITSDTPARFFP